MVRNIRNKIILIFLVLIFGFVKSGFSFNLTENEFFTKDLILSVTARSLGMGNTFISAGQGAEAIFYNPSLINKKRNKRARIGFSLDSLKQVFGQDENESMFSSSSWINMSGTGFLFPVSNSITGGAGWKPYMDLNYECKKNEYTENIISKIINLRNTGGIYKFIFCGGVKILSGLDFGVNINFLQGKENLDNYNYTIVGSSKTVHSGSKSFGGWGIETGLNFDILKDKLDCAVKWTLPFTLKSKWNEKKEYFRWIHDKWNIYQTTNKEGEIKNFFPYQIGVGITYAFAEVEKSFISFDLEKIFWSEYYFKEKVKENPRFRDTTRISAGVEHFIGFDTALRFGFSYIPHRHYDLSALTEMTAGAGLWRSKYINIDIAGSYGRRNFYEKCILSGQKQIVDETIKRFLVTVGLEF